jgi:tRNA pseudouridine32 synthase / 23S rRNA pseudouridine746 synthase
MAHRPRQTFARRQHLNARAHSVATLHTSHPRNTFMLETKNGVAPSCVLLPRGPWPLLIDFLSERFTHVGRDVWLARLHAGEVRNAQGRALSPNEPYPVADGATPTEHAPQKIYYYRSVPAEPRIPFDEHIIYQDTHLLVADKPHWLPVTPSGRYVQETLLVRLKNRTGINALSPLHRIDRDTAGLVLFSVQAATRGAYQQLFRSRTVEKHYEAIAPWRAGLALPLVHKSRLVESAHFLQMHEVSGPANSETRIALLAQHGALAHYALQPITGKKHQLRVHMNALGLPIVGDQIYPTLTPQKLQWTATDYAQPLQLLAKSIGFIDPLSGKRHEFFSAQRLKKLSDF